MRTSALIIALLCLTSLPATAQEKKPTPTPKPGETDDVVRVSTGTSYAFENRVPRMLKRDFAPGGTVDISFKDQELETQFAKQLGVPVLLANVTQQVYQMARAAGFNKEDGSAVLKVLEKLAGVTVGRNENT